MMFIKDSTNYECNGRMPREKQERDRINER